jgi:pimeloyl-ACP methyl ester carboxylesterase
MARRAGWSVRVVLATALTSVLATVMAACSTAAPAPSGPTASVPASSTSPPVTLAGAYRTVPDGRLLVVDSSGVLLDSGDGAVRLTTTAGDGWDVGTSLGFASPVTGHLTLAGARLTWTRPGAATVQADRVDLVGSDLTVPVDGAVAAASVLEPADASAGHRRAGLVIVHEGGPRTRADVDLWARFWAASGFVVLTYDKRGTGSSTGVFPGDAPTAAVVDTLAGDVRRLVHALATRPEVDPRRVGLVGHSQAGWIVPAAADAEVRFALVMSGSATDGAVEDGYAALTSDGNADPGLNDRQVAARLAAVHGEYDPTASLRALRIPTTWVYGGHDRAVPAGLAAAAVRRDVRGASVVTLPTGDHFLYDTPHGTFPEEPAAQGYAAGLFPLLVRWAQTRSA